MDAPITFTMSQFVSNFLAICAGISAIGVAFTWILKMVGVIQKPVKDKSQAIADRFAATDQRINTVEITLNKSIEKYEKLIAHYHQTAHHHDEAINQLAEGQKLLLEVQRASIDFKLNDGTDKTALKAMDEKLDKYLTNLAYNDKFKSSTDAWYDELLKDKEDMDEKSNK